MDIITKIDNLSLKGKGSYKDVDEAIANLQDADLAPKKYVDSKSLYVNIYDFGCVGDGATNDYNAFLEAVNFAILNNKPLYIPNKDYFLKDVDQINLTGISKIVCEGRLLVEAIDSLDEGWKPVFAFEGTKVEVDSGINITKEDNEITLSAGSRDYKQGDVFFLVSDDNIEGARDNDYKGQRLTMYSYNEVSGVITFNEKFQFDLTDAVLFNNDYNPNINIDGLSIICTNGVSRTGISFIFSTIKLSNIYISNFKYSGLTIGSCYSVIRGYEGDSFYETGSVTSYGLTIGDLSLSYSYNLNLSGGRHAIAHGGGFSFLETDIGISSDKFARYGAVSYVYDSVFSSTEEASFDSHTVTNKVSASNCIINGGVYSMASLNYFNNCTINSQGVYGRVYLGGEDTVNQVSHFNSCTFNLRFASLFQTSSRTKELKISGCEFLIPASPTSLDFITTIGVIDNLNMFNNVFKGVDLKMTFNIDKIKNLNINGLILNKILGIRFLSFEGRESIKISNVRLTDLTLPIRVDEEIVPINMSDINIDGVGGFAAIRVYNSENVIINGLSVSGISRHNAPSISGMSESGNIVVSNAFFGSENNDWDFKVAKGNLVISNSVFEKGLEPDPLSTAEVNIVNSIYQGNFVPSM